MAFTLVYSAEHYVVDILAGWLLAAVVALVVNRLETRAAGRSGRSLESRIGKSDVPDTPPSPLPSPKPLEPSTSPPVLTS
jgi:hypothetical protein